MPNSKKLLQAAAGSAAGAGEPTNIEDIFSASIYEGTSSTKTISNGISLGDSAGSYILLLDGESDISDTGASLTDFNNDIGTASTAPWEGATALDFTSGTDTSVLRVDTNIFSSFQTNQDFTVEAYVYFTSQPSVKAIFGINDRSNGNNIFVVTTGYSGGTTVLYNTGDHTFETTASYTLNTWIHYAFVHKSGKQYLYIDGELVGENSKSLTSFTNSYFFVGNESDGTAGQGSGNLFPGYISDVRVSDHARYDAPFTPPTSNSGDGGLVWIKGRDQSRENTLTDTERGVTKTLNSNSGVYELTKTGGLKEFNSNGFTIGSDSDWNFDGESYVSWSFKKTPKFFDVVTVDVPDPEPTNMTIDHNLGQEVGMVIIKNYLHSYPWYVWHRSLGSNYYMQLNSTAGKSYVGGSGFSSSSTQITIPGSFLHSGTNNGEAVLYLFAHNNGDGDFGPDGDQDVISCGTYTGNGSDARTINLGWEAQWVMLKRIDGGTNDWAIFDDMRGLHVRGGTSSKYLRWNQNSTEASSGQVFYDRRGFMLDAGDYNSSGETYIYMAIRRGPMAVPEVPEKVFAVEKSNNGSGTLPVDIVPPISFTPDFGFIIRYLLNGSTVSKLSYIGSRLQGYGKSLLADRTSVEGTATLYSFDTSDAPLVGDGGGANDTGATNIHWLWKRAPSFCDVVCYDGSGSSQTISHNLGVAPEMIWVKGRNYAEHWTVYHSGLGATKYINLNQNGTPSTSSAAWGNTAPTDSSFTVNTYNAVNENGYRYIAYLFATLEGVSKVGSYTYSGSALNVDCGFSNGARFVMIKRTDSTGNWNVFDTVRGIVTNAADPELTINSDAAQSSFDWIDPYSAGFTLKASAWNNGTYIFYAIA